MYYIEPSWEAYLVANQLNDFAVLWQTKMQIVDIANRQGAGWSETGRYLLPIPYKNNLAFYIKRQQNYTRFHWRSPIRGQPTLARELINLMLCDRHHIPVVTPLIYLSRDQGGCRQAILVTQALDDMQALNESSAILALSRTNKKHLLKKIADELRKLHDIGYQHGCLYPKHIFYRIDVGNNNEPQICFIDLEKMHRTRFYNKGIRRDLDSLNRHDHLFSFRDRQFFLQCYTQNDKLLMKKIIRQLNP